MQQHDFSFITEPANPFPNPKKSPFGPGSSSLLGKLALVGGLIVVIIVAFVLIKSSLGGNSFDSAPLVTVAADQQELTHLTANLSQKQGLAVSTLNSANTIQLTMPEAQGKLLAYLKKNGVKVSTKQLGTKASSSTDTLLSTAYTNGTYDQAYQTVISGQLKTYMRDLKAAYFSDKGANGRALLNHDYEAAQLLQTQLTSPSS